MLAAAAVYGAEARSSTGLTGAWTSLPALLFLAGSVALLTAAAGDLRAAIHVVVLHDTRGRRRWEEAETQLVLWQKIQQGQEHDLNNALSAVDGTLLSLVRGRDQLPAATVDRLTVAVREQIQWLRTSLVGGDGQARAYDVYPLLAALVDLRSEGSQLVRLDADRGLKAYGRADRLAVAVNNLLANAAVHAASSDVTLSARRVTRPRGDVVEIVVSDHGPGLARSERSRAFQRGWRGPASADRTGSGLGLYQCRELMAGEGGRVYLLPTDEAATSGSEGLSVHLELPAAGAGPATGENIGTASRPGALSSRSA